MKEGMKQSFKTVDFFSATTDVWSRSNKSFIAVSVHYYGADLKLHSSFLACEAFEGRHTADKVTEKLKNIFERFGILQKVFFITTDGAGEYTAALKRDGDDYRTLRMWKSAFETSAADDVHDTVEDEDEDEDDDDNDDRFFRLDPEGNENEPNSFPHPQNDTAQSFEMHCEDEVPILPNMNRVSCSSHLLDKIGKIDAMNALSDEAFRTKFNNAFETLKQIWDLKESRLNAEVFTRLTGKKLVGPHRIRWLQTYTAVSTAVLWKFTSIFMSVKHLGKVNSRFI